MITHLGNDEISQLSFPDTEVIGFNLLPDFARFYLACDEAFVDAGSGGKTIKDVSISINDFDKLSIREFDSERNTWDDVVYSKSFDLKDVCEFNIDEDKVMLRGFSRQRGLWTEFVFTGGAINVTHQS